jgi:putative PEP-CTERM system histidine kinase
MVLVIPHSAFYYSPEFEIEKVLFLGDAGYFYNLLLLLFFITTIANLEATLRSSSGVKRWQIKYLLLGVMGILGFNIFYYSHALLYRSIDMNFLPVRAGAYLISVVIIGFSILRHKLMEVEIAVSRGIFFRSLSIFVVGFYLLGLGLIGQGMRYLGPHVGKNIMTFLSFTGAIAVLVILLSEQLRKKIMVFINKNFYSQKYDYRAQWLQFTQLIASKHSFEELMVAIAKGFKDAIGVKGASIWLQEKGNGEFYCAKTIHAPVVKVKPGKKLLELLEKKGWIFNINDKKSREITSKNKDFIEKSKANLIIPLLNIDQLIGFIILREGLVRSDYNFEDYDLLKTLARQATFAILKERLTEELYEAKEMEAIGKLSSFIIHDLKNAASMLTLLAQNAEEHMNNPDFQRDAIRSVSNTAEKINDIMQKLKELPHRMDLRFEYADLGSVIRESTNELSMNGSERLNYKEVEPVMTMFDREEIRKVAVNLLLNAIDATRGEGLITIKVGIQNDMGYFVVSDNGLGMSKEFIEKRLFRPFQTTKKKGLGVGLYQCKTIVEAHSGLLKVKSREGEGADFSVYLPLKKQTDMKQQF